MKHMFLASAIASLAGVTILYAAGSQSAQRTPGSSFTAQSAQGQPAGRARPARGATHDHVVNAEFVAYDAGSKTMTFRDDTGQTSTAPLEGRAIREIFGELRLKKGDHVMLTCRDNAKGEHQEVVDMWPAKGTA